MYAKTFLHEFNYSNDWFFSHYYPYFQNKLATENVGIFYQHFWVLKRGATETPTATITTIKGYNL